MARASNGHRRYIWILAALAPLAACNPPLEQESAEREFNAWANQVEQANGNGQESAPVDLEEPANILARVVPANAQ